MQEEKALLSSVLDEEELQKIEQMILKRSISVLDPSLRSRFLYPRVAFPPLACFSFCLARSHHTHFTHHITRIAHINPHHHHPRHLMQTPHPNACVRRGAGEPRQAQEACRAHTQGQERSVSSEPNVCAS